MGGDESAGRAGEDDDEDEEEEEKDIRQWLGRDGEGAGPVTLIDGE